MLKYNYTTVSTSSSSCSGPNLHDCIALGAYEYGFEQSPTVVPSSSSESSQLSSLPAVGMGTEESVQPLPNQNDDVDEIQRLPIVLRLLDESRSLASMQSFSADLKQQQKEIDTTHEGAADGGKPDGTITRTEEGECSSSSEMDTLLDTIVQRLEDRATYYSIAEHIDLVTNHIVPSVTTSSSKNYSNNNMSLPISKLRPLVGAKKKVPQRQQQQQSISSRSSTNDVTTKYFDISELETLLQQQQQSSTDTETAVSTTTSQKNKKKTKLHKQSRRYSNETSTSKTTNGPVVNDDTDAAGTGGGADELTGVTTMTTDIHETGLEENDTADSYHLGVNDEYDTTTTTNTKKRNRGKVNSSASTSDWTQSNTTNIEDTIDYKVYKTTLELIQITIASLQPPSPQQHLESSSSSSSGGMRRLSLQNDSGSNSRKNDDHNDDDRGTADKHDDDDHNHPYKYIGTTAASLPLSSSLTSISFKWDDSLLATTATTATTTINRTKSPIYIMDIPSTISSIMYHAPVLRHEHIASALCRAGFTQTPNYIVNMGANCPAVVQGLINGCISVYRTAHEAITTAMVEARAVVPVGSVSTNTSMQQQVQIPPLFINDSDRRIHRQYMKIIHICIESVRRLSQLSPREAHRTMHLLRQTAGYQLSSYSFTMDCMVPLQLEICMQHDPLSACFLMIEQLHCPSTVFVLRDENGEKNTNNNAVSYTEILNLRDYLNHNTDLLLLSNVWNFLFNEISSLPLPIPRLSIVLMTYITFVSNISMNRYRMSNDEPTIIFSCRKKLFEILDELRRQCSVDMSNTNQSMSGAYDLLIVALISTNAVLLAADTKHNNVHAGDVKTILDRSRVPPQSHMLSLRISLALQYGDSQSLHDIIIETRILHAHQSHRIQTRQEQDNHFLTQLDDYCSWILLSHKNSFEKFRIEDDALYSNKAPYLTMSPSIALQLMKCIGVPLPVKMDVVTKLLQLVLWNKQCAVLYVQDPLAVEFIDRATSLLLTNQDSKLPLIMPMQLETILMKVNFMVVNGGESMQILLQLLYCFTFLRSEPTSPFRIDPRILPLNLVWELCERSDITVMIHKSVVSVLKHDIDFFCPEVPIGYKYQMVESRQRRRCYADTPILENKTKTEYAIFLRTISSKPYVDLSGLLAEQAFIEARRYLSESDLITVCASVLLSQISTPALYFTYPMLYRDPLTLLKCPVSVWKRRGTRRIIVAILSRLLDIHEQVLYDEAPNEDVFDELLSSRNAIVVTCLLRITCSSILSRTGHQQCEMTFGLMRKLVAAHPGLTPLLIKQRLDEIEIDWMIKFIPEIMIDIKTLSELLSDRSSLSAAERLTVADSNVRIAVVHGLRNDDVSVSVSLACASQLLSSFFLILGPVGVPVNALIAVGDEFDATQISRKAAFRLLSALQTMRSFQTRLRKDMLLILQKFAGMCKSESVAGGLPTAIASRQKTLLKDLLDSVGRVINSMSSGGVANDRNSVKLAIKI